MLQSLTSKLIFAFALVIFVCLFSAGTAFVVFLRNQEVEDAREQMGRLAEPLALRVTYLEWMGLPPEEMAPLLKDYADQLGVRVLLVDKATSRVLIDTEGNLVGEEVPQFQASNVGTQHVGRIWVWQVRIHEDEGNLLLFTPLDRFVGQEGLSATLLSHYRTVVAVPEENITSSWLDVLPRLGFAGGIALGISVAMALVLSRSIGGPLRQITRASEEMARGNYDQQIKVEGRDEVGRLATAFNCMAQEVSQSEATLRQFLADASHELRTPLTSIQGFSQALADGDIESPEQTVEAARIINQEAQRMRALVDDLMYLSQMESGQVMMQREKLDLQDLLQTCLERFQRQAQEKGLQMRLEASSLPEIEGDVRRLERVFSNLLGNAVHYTPNEGIITVQAVQASLSTLQKGGPSAGKRAHPSNGVVQVSVHNTGSWILPEHLPRVCERFYQVSKTANDEGHTGLGLAIASEIVHAHGGTLTVRSSQAEGTEFVVKLPLMQPEGQLPSKS